MDLRLGDCLELMKDIQDNLEYLIESYTNEGDVVLDNTMGSGSTGVACVNTDRNFIGMELDENYFSIASDRINRTIEEKNNSLW